MEQLSLSEYQNDEGRRLLPDGYMTSLEVLPDETLPLIRHTSTTPRVWNHNDSGPCASMDLAPVHFSRSLQTQQSANFRPKMMNEMEKLPEDVKLTKANYLSPGLRGRVNVIEALQEFWQKKLVTGGGCNLQHGVGVSYACEPAATPPYVCYVTLPNGCSFGCLNTCKDRAEARRSAAHIALVNSVYNELPSRKITDEFIENAIQEALTTARLDSDGPMSAVGAYRFVLEATRGQTMLDYMALANNLLVMHWSGALSKLSRCHATRQDVLKAAMTAHWLSEDGRSEMALDWIAVEHREPGRINAELRTAWSELESARCRGRELAFPRLKRDVLQLAASQCRLN